MHDRSHIREDGRRTARAWQILASGRARRAGAGARVGGRALGVSAWWISVAWGAAGPAHGFGDKSLFLSSIQTGRRKILFL
jgi:hypothetical protein